MKVTIEGDNLKISDGFHTIEELYEHRIILFITLCRLYRSINDKAIWISLKHSDGSNYDGWFIMGINREKDKQISYHLPLRFWGICKTIAEVLDKAPEWDGHTSNDVLKRISQLYPTLNEGRII